MRWIFFLLLAANLAFFVWRALIFPPTYPLTERARNTYPGHVESAQQLVLLEELDPSVVQERATAEIASAPSLCLMVGAFASQTDAHQFMTRLAALDVKSFEHPVDLSAGEGYWVYLRPFSSREEARRRLAELHARGVDSYIIPRGELENGISLGVFTRRDLADARMSELKRLGLPVNLHNIERSYREHWIMLGEGEEHKLDESVWLSLMQENISLRRRQNLCSDVASSKNFH